MFSRIFLSVLLITCVYTYTLKSIKDNDYTNFQKLPDNFNSELNGIKSVKANLKSDFEVLRLMKYIISDTFAQRLLEKLHEDQKLHKEQ